MSNLVDHARIELELVGEDEATIDGLISVIQVFADMGHSGTSAEAAIHQLSLLLRFKNLTPLTDSPNEWVDVSESIGTQMWQSKRNPEAFSLDHGNTYRLLTNDKISYKSKKHKDQD